MPCLLRMLPCPALQEMVEVAQRLGPQLHQALDGYLVRPNGGG